MKTNAFHVIWGGGGEVHFSELHLCSNSKLKLNNFKPLFENNSGKPDPGSIILK